MKRWLFAIVVVGLVALGIAFLMSVVSGARFVTGTVDSVVGDIVRVSGISPWLVRGIVIIVTIPFFWSVAQLTKKWWGHGSLGAGLDLYLNKHGIVVVVYVAAFFLTMYGASRGSYVSLTGETLKWCAETPEGIRVFDVEGVDPVYGIPLRPCSPDQVRALRKIEVGIDGPKALTVGDPRTFEFFDGVSGRPRAWCYRNPDGTYEIYDKAGIHPRTGAPLIAVNAAVVQELVQLHELKSKLAAETVRQDAAAEDARQGQVLLERYTNPGPPNQANRTEVALLVAGDPPPDGLPQALAEAIRQRNADPIEHLFKPAFHADGRAGALAAGDWGALSALKLGDRVDAILTVVIRVTLAENSQFEGMSTATLALNLNCMELQARRACGARALTAHGSGFSREAAASNAVEKISPGLPAALASMQF